MARRAGARGRWPGTDARPRLVAWNRRLPAAGGPEPTPARGWWPEPAPAPLETGGRWLGGQAAITAAATREPATGEIHVTVPLLWLKPQ
jgi:hypothetical protein